MQPWPALLRGARAAWGEGDVAQARILAQTACRHAPAEPAPLFFLRALLLSQAEPSANELLPSLERFPAFAEGWEELGHTLAAHHISAARVAWRRAAEAYANREAEASDGMAAWQLGRVLRRLGDPTAARLAFQRAIAQAPGLAHTRSLRS